MTDSYLYEEAGNVCGSVTRIDIGSVRTSYSLGSLAGAAEYCAYVEVVNETGASAASATVTGWTLPAAPTSLSGSSVGLDSSEVSWSWTNPSGTLIDDYLYWEVGSSCDSAGKVDIGSVVTSYSLRSLTGATEYCAYVDAVSAAGLSAASAVSTATTVPSAPTGLVVSGTTPTSISLAWTNPPGAVINDTVGYGASCSSISHWNSTSGPAGSYTILDLSPGTDSCFGVQVWSSGGGSSLSFVNATTAQSSAGGGTSSNLLLTNPYFVMGAVAATGLAAGLIAYIIHRRNRIQIGGPGSPPV